MIVDLHGGTVHAVSEGLGRGAQFSVRLPLHLQTQPPAATEDAPRPGGAVRRVLIVEDNVDTMESMKMLLEVSSHTVVAARTALDALSAAHASVFDVVVCDIGLPDGMSGYQVPRGLADHPQRSRMTLIALSGYGREEDKRCARQTGFDHYLVKRIDAAWLANLLAASREDAGAPG